jgi:AIPR protein
MDPKNSVVLHAPIARRMPAPADAPAELSSVETHIFRVKATEVPPGIPDDANPREPNLNRQVYRRVRASLNGAEGEGSFHLKHGGIVLVAEKVERISDQRDRYRLWFNPAVKQGIANGNHSYQLLLDAQDNNGIPDNQYVEIKVHTGVPPEVVPDLAEGLNTSMQVREESLADLRNQFEWLKNSLGPLGEKRVSWHEGDEGEYDVREVIALLMALDPTRYRLEDPVGIENTYARLSSVFRSYLADPDRVERFGPIALEALELYEYIRYSATKLWQGRFRRTVIADTKKNSLFSFPFLPNEKGNPRTSDARLTKAAAIPCFTAFRALVEVPDDGTVTWRYDFESIKSMWDEYGAEVMREVHDAVTKQYNGNTHYAGRSVMLYRATTKTLELADLRRRIASDE